MTAQVELSFTPLPAHVRTARLVATAVARRSGIEESLLDEIRLAVGEACSRAVEAHRLHCPAEPVRILLSDRDGRFEVVVTDAVPGGEDDHAAMRAVIDDPAAHAALSSLSAEAMDDQAASGPPQLAVPSSQGAGAAVGDVAGAAAAGADRAARDESGVTAQASAGQPSKASGGDGASGNGGLPAGIGLAVIAGLADDVHISATGAGVSIRMSWPLRAAE